MIEITAEVRAAIDRAAGDMELAGDEYIEPEPRSRPGPPASGWQGG